MKKILFFLFLTFGVAQAQPANQAGFLNGWTNRTFARQTAANAMIHVNGPLTPTLSVSPSVTPATPKPTVPTS